LGGAGASAAAGVAQPALCRDVATVSSLVIIRKNGFKVPELQPGIPQDVPVTNPALVRGVASALCGLPDMPPGLYHCPALLLGTVYTLHFTVDGGPLPLVTVNGTGCETVTGVGHVRRATSPEFWKVFAKAVGANSPGVFGGGNRQSSCQPLATREARTASCEGGARPGAGLA
jgi:hypothetical protein